MFISFSPSFTGPAIPAWIEGWAWRNGRWNLRVLTRERGRWTLAFQSPWELHNTRVFEPSTSGMKTRGTLIRPFRIRDLSALSPLIEPREVLGPMLSGATSGDHAIYVAETAEGKLLFPAWTLIDQLWIWSAKALQALLMPNSLDVLMRCSVGRDGSREIAVSRDLASSPLTKIAASRISWLASCDDARRSWGSVMSHATKGQINAALPKASMQGWIWGAEIRAGLLACELTSVDIQFDTNDARPVRVGRRLCREVQR